MKKIYPIDCEYCGKRLATLEMELWTGARTRLICNPPCDKNPLKIKPLASKGGVLVVQK